MKPNETKFEPRSSVAWLISGFGPRIALAPEGDPPPAVVPPVPSAEPPKPADPAAPPVDPAKPAEPGSLLDKKPEDKPADAPVVEPITLENLKLPEGWSIPDDQKEAAKGFLDMMNDATLSPGDRAAKLIEMYAKASTEGSEKATNDWNNLQTDWQKQCREDPDIGGAKLEPMLGQISVLLDEYGTPELRGVFNVTGAGNNPHMVKFLSKVATALGEGKPAPGAQPAAAQTSLAERMYPSMKKG